MDELVMVCLFAEVEVRTERVFEKMDQQVSSKDEQRRACAGE
jgi:hypothetical protein